MNKLIAVTLIMISGTLQAQTVILINGEPTEVVLQHSEIVEVMPSDVSDHMKEYDTTIPAKWNASFTVQTEFPTLPPPNVLAKRYSEIVVVIDEE